MKLSITVTVDEAADEVSFLTTEATPDDLVSYLRGLFAEGQREVKIKIASRREIVIDERQPSLLEVPARVRQEAPV